jgi:hypothetical protein
LIKAHYLGYSIGEVEVTFHPRKKGTAKGGGVKHILRTFRDIFRFWFKWVVLKQPIAVRRPLEVHSSEALESQDKGEARGAAAEQKVAG